MSLPLVVCPFSDIEGEGGCVNVYDLAVENMNVRFLGHSILVSGSFIVVLFSRFLASKKRAMLNGGR
ncbi:uncharacterized protein C8A04DRAFT_25758 [Dichotomopilus funicola]|uniref:Uncharacterized protein n=1 Tax=Dichotomopilus funicola TaxID=1934379 RepID=A0AAN6V837_9PEZI|nr:hypothetical protein C8A04DRAFT_25758 [Dichotomopilus funicola]